MGAWAGKEISQATYLGWMSNPDGFNYFVNNVLPDVIGGGAKIDNPAGSNLGPQADASTVVQATSFYGEKLGLQIPPNSLQPSAAPAPVADIPKTDPNADAKSQIKATLDSWGLGSLDDMAWNLITTGASSDQVVQAVRATDVYKTRFAGNVQRQAAGYTPLTEAQYLSYEDTARGVLRTAGLPSGFYDDPSDFANLIGKDVSPSELNSRVQLAGQVLNQSPPEVRQQLQTLYGLSDADMTAALLDPDKALPLLEKKVNSATLAGTAAIAGYGQLNQMDAERLNDLGVSQQQAQTGFSNLAGKSFLFQGMPGEGGDITTEQQIEAQFGGNAQDLAAIKQRQKARAAAFGSGDFASSQAGVVGLGQAKTSAS